jgi:anti-sigma B factor antagonist
MDPQPNQLVTVQRLDAAVIMTIECEQVDSQLLARLEREATVMSIRGIRRPVVIKMDRVELIPSVMMGALLNLMRNLKRRGLRMMLVGLNPSIRGTFSVTHLDRLFEVYDTEEEARGAMRRHARL